MKQKKNIVVGLGEIGKPILKLFSKHDLVIGYDINPKLMNKKIFEQFSSLDTLFLHVCIPFNEKFIKSVILLIKKFDPDCVVIHSTVKPFTTKKIQEMSSIPLSIVLYVVFIKECYMILYVIQNFMRLKIIHLG